MGETIITKAKTSTVGLTTEEVRKICRGVGSTDSAEQMLCVVEDELKQGFDFVKKYPHMVTVFGSARTPETDFYYKAARKLGERVVKECGFAITTGGGPGIMEAANRGAADAGGHSLGMTIELPMEQSTNQYVGEAMDFYFFFTRKFIMRYSAKVFVFFPGGFGTMDEFFETITLMQTHKTPHVPIYLYGSEFWKPMLVAIKEELKRGLINNDDMELYIVTDSDDEIINTIKNLEQK